VSIRAQWPVLIARATECVCVSVIRCCCGCAGVSNAVVEVWSGYRVGESRAAVRCTQRCRLVDCLSSCYSDESCFGVDYDATNRSCYTLNASSTCTSLTPAADLTHLSTAHCGTPITRPPLTTYVKLVQICNRNRTCMAPGRGSKICHPIKKSG